MAYVVFNYLYRDASNYKAWGAVLLEDDMPGRRSEELGSSLSGVNFVARQLGVRDLRADLWKWSGGLPNEDDHEWHEICGISAATDEDSQTYPVAGFLSAFLNRLERARIPVG
ncbi:MAG: hypothetical protein ACK4KX_01880 [Parvibaculum sp.]|jgi:hypothetical protein|uniref:hypothetical protein n=1 Tax=Parvibaculum sp. TaxID=2024848 RepID=UPI00391D499E